jgi:septal ring factor EnvC (AmiA/AmiB activator)
MQVRVTGTNLVRDTSTRMLNNMDTSAKSEYLAKSRELKARKEEINKLKDDVSELRKDIGDIKSMLQQILERS